MLLLWLHLGSWDEVVRRGEGVSTEEEKRKFRKGRSSARESRNDNRKREEDEGQDEDQDEQEVCSGKR